MRNSRAMRLRAAGGPIFAVTAVLCSAQQNTGRMDGAVQTTAGKPVPRAGVVVSLMLTSRTAPFQPFITGALTAADGTFSVTGLPAGKFSVCPFALEDTTLLPPCHWGSEPTVTLAAGQTVVMPPIQLQKGVDLHLRVNDPQGIRGSNEGKVIGSGMFTAVSSPKGITIPVSLTGSDAAGFDHHLTVPADTDLKLMVHGGSFSLKDEKGSDVGSQGLVQLIHIPAAKGQEQHVVTVTGLNPGK